MVRLRRSRSLHERVTRVIAGADEVDAVALDIASYQAEHCAAIARLFRAHGVDPATLTCVADIPAVPTSAFKLTRVAAHPPEEDEIIFRTSGTTLGARGEHALWSTRTYETAAMAFGRSRLSPDVQTRFSALMLLPQPTLAPDSSLGFMCAAFARVWADRASYHLQAGVLSVEGVEREIAAARALQLPVLLLGTSFAFVHLLDELAGKPLPLPEGSRIMQTGGTKGRSRKVSAEELAASLASCFHVDPRAVVSEYGMTELGSQAYEGTIRAWLLGESARRSVLIPPRWMRVTAVHPETLRPVLRGETGIARIVDLVNVDSAVVVQTEDLVREVEGGFVLEGRLSGAPPRGCSLAAQEMLGG